MNNKKKWLSIAVISLSISALIYGIVNFYNKNENWELILWPILTILLWVSIYLNNKLNFHLVCS